MGQSVVEQPGDQTGGNPRQGFEDEYPFASKFFDLGGTRYHYIDEGSGNPLLFVHGNPTWSFAWRNLVKELSPDYRTIAVDHVGCGFSDKPQNYSYVLQQHVENLCRLIESLDLKQITLVAHDWGGAIGMGAAVRLPDRFARFVLLNTAAFPGGRIPQRIALCRLPLFGPLAVCGFNAFARAALRRAVVHPERMTPAVRTGYLAPYGNWADRIAILRFVQDIPLKRTHPSYATLAGIGQQLAQFQERPMLLLWGERDWCFTVDFLNEFQRRFPNAGTVRFPDAGHYLFEDAREEILPPLREFLAHTSDS